MWEKCIFGCLLHVSPVGANQRKRWCFCFAKQPKQDADFWPNDKGFHLEFSANRGLPLPLRRGVCETKSKKGPPDTENPSNIGFAALGGGLRPWSQTMVSEGARPQGRSEFAKNWLLPSFDKSSDWLDASEDLVTRRSGALSFVTRK